MRIGNAPKIGAMFKQNTQNRGYFDEIFVKTALNFSGGKGPPSNRIRVGKYWNTKSDR